MLKPWSNISMTNCACYIKVFSIEVYTANVYKFLIIDLTIFVVSSLDESQVYL